MAKKSNNQYGSMTRRDFVGGTLIGSGAALLAANAPGLMRDASAATRFPQTISAPLNDLNDSWTGPGGIGDYATANGNTHDVVNAAHSFRNDDFADRIATAASTGETYDVVVVGAGFAGCTAAMTYHEADPSAKVLILDNHDIFGGEAKQNEFDVDGYRLWGPQGSNGNPWPPELASASGFPAPLWQELDLPDEFEWQEAMNSEVKIPVDVYGPMHISWEAADLGWFDNDGNMALNPWSNRFAKVNISDQLKQDLIWMETYRQPPRREDWAEWLDSMTYKEFIENEMGIRSDVHSYLNPQTAAMGCGLGTDVISAYSAFSFIQPGVIAYLRYLGAGDPTDQIYLASFPGGNTGILRHIVKRIIPGAFGDANTLTEIISNPVNWAILDAPNETVRMRLGSLVVNVEHNGAPESADSVSVTYLKDGQMHRVRAGRVIMSGQQHMNKRVVSGLPDEYIEAMNQFMHSPIMTINVALRNWKFMDKLGIAAARWFGDFGWFTTLRRQMILDVKEPMPLNPDKPTVLTMYNSFCIPGLPVAEQCVAARMKMFAMSYAQVEQKVREEFTTMFTNGGFDWKRDVAGITVNRWGHAYVVQPPGFYFGKDGKPPPSDIIRNPFGRISFCHSELAGAQMWETAVVEGERAATQMLDL